MNPDTAETLGSMTSKKRPMRRIRPGSQTAFAGGLPKVTAAESLPAPERVRDMTAFERNLLAAVGLTAEQVRRLAATCGGAR